MIGDLYARKSTKDARRSAARQEREWRADCTAEDVEPGRVFVDPDLSASRYARKARPDYNALLAHIQSGACQMLCLWEASRGTRQLHEWVGLLDLCRTTGTLIRVFGEPEQTFDPRKQRDREALVTEGMRAESESERLSRRVRAGTRDSALRGVPPGPLLYGYHRVYDPNTKQFRELVVVPEQATLIRRLVADTLAGIPLHTQARRLNDEGVPTPSGVGAHTGGHIHRILRHPGYVGDRVYRGEVIARDCWPAIITRDERRKLLAVLDDPSRDRRQMHAGSVLVYPLSGAALCGKCERVLRSAKLGSRYSCTWRGCQAVTAPRQAMEEAVEATILPRLRRPDAAELFQPRADDGQMAAVRRELGELREHLDGFYQQAAMRRLSAEGLARVEAQTLPAIDRLERRLRALSMPPVLQDLQGVDVAGTWHALPAGVRREVVLALARVVLSPVGKAGRWSLWRLGGSRWHGDDRTWGDIWAADGAPM